MIKELQTVVARQSDGGTVRIVEWAEYGDTTTTGGFSQKETIRHLTVADTGGPVERLSKGRYKIVGPEIEVTSDDPRAP
jgi:hypothetical protein